MGREVHVGVVTNNTDPKMQGRIQAKIPTLTGDDTYPDWIQPRFPLAGEGHGMFFVPEVGDQVNIDVADGEQGIEDPDAFWSQSEFKLGDMAKVFTKEMSSYPKFKGLVTKAGHRFIVDDSSGLEKFSYEHPNGSKMEFDGQKNIKITHPDGTTFTMDSSMQTSIVHASGAKIVIDPTGNINIFGTVMVKVGSASGAFEPVALALKTMTEFAKIVVDATMLKAVFTAWNPVNPIEVDALALKAAITAWASTPLVLIPPAAINTQAS